ncbi:MAG: hypothetical protein LBV12_00920 [Puniceicoccales bacterium]|jgi:hypothetical protein|nr:hypothetical protein [Puniceicoccales bacterium]
MSNPRNRRRTKGAFGKPKPRTVGPVFRNIPANMPVRESAKDAFNISDALINFAKPITEQAGNNHTAIRGAMNVAVLLWNALIEGPAAIETAKQKLLALPGATAEQVEDLITTMTARKTELYPDIKQLVCDYSLNFTKKGANIRVASMNIAPPGVEKTDIAGKLGAVPAASPAPAPTPAEPEKSSDPESK